MVQFVGETNLDACPGDHRADLADSLPGHPRQLWVRVRPGDQEEAAVACGVALRHQSRGEPDLHANPVRDAKPAAGCVGYSDRVGDNHLDDGRRLATLPLGGRGSGAVLHLGFISDRAATVDHGDELGTIMIHKMLEFFGTLSLENNGGFASVRTKAKKLGFEKGDTIVTKVRGDGREYVLNLYLNRPLIAFSYRATVQTKQDEWIKVERAAK